MKACQNELRKWHIASILSKRPTGYHNIVLSHWFHHWVCGGKKNNNRQSYGRRYKEIAHAIVIHARRKCAARLCLAWPDSRSARARACVCTRFNSDIAVERETHRKNHCSLCYSLTEMTYRIVYAVRALRSTITYCANENAYCLKSHGGRTARALFLSLFLSRDIFVLRQNLLIFYIDWARVMFTFLLFLTGAADIYALILSLFDA